MSIARGRSPKTIFGFLIAWAVLLWPPIVNQSPFMLPDTTTYVRGVDAGVYKATGHRTAWTQEFLKRFPASAPDAAPTPDDGAQAAAPPASVAGPQSFVLSGRSIYYGALLYLSYLLGSLWLAVVLQALLTCACIALTLSRFRQQQGRPPSPAELPLVAGFLALLTSIGYFTGFLMPDFAVPLGILAFAHIILFWRVETRARRWFWWGILAYAALAHSATLLIIGAMTAIALAVWLLRLFPIDKRAFVPVAAALLLAVAGEAIFSFGVEKATGDPPVRPPFLTARIIADGPGYDYLRTHCPQSGFLICKYVDRLPAPSDNFLWDPTLGKGVFSALPSGESRALAEEQSRFVLAVFADRPVDVLISSTGAVLRQFGQVGLWEFNYFPIDKIWMAQKLPADVLGMMQRSAAYHARMPVAVVEAATVPLLLLSLAIIVWTAVKSGREGRALTAFAIIVCVGLLFNVLVCGALSTPHERYQMRAIWLLPFIALCLVPPARPRLSAAPAE